MRGDAPTAMRSETPSAMRRETPTAMRRETPTATRRNAPSSSGERGVILLFTVLAVLALGLVGATLLRAAATSAAIGANLATRQQAMLAASAAVEQAIGTLFGESAMLDTTRDDPPRNYFAQRQPGEDARGVPLALQSIDAYPAGMGTIDAGEGFVARHVIERLCVSPGDATIANCTLSPPSVDAASGLPTASEPPRTPYYRVSVRVDGPRAATTFAQAMLTAAPIHRLAWRVLDDP